MVRYVREVCSKFAFVVAPGRNPRHIVILYKGRIFSAEVLDDQYEPLTPPEIKRYICDFLDKQYIVNKQNLIYNNIILGFGLIKSSTATRNIAIKPA